jgi:small neutral amino acid transporter SnatA (MarC family)
MGMQSFNFLCHEFVVALSFLACIAGLVLLWDRKQNQNEAEETERILFRMSFSYWLVYCVAFGIQKIVLPDWETVIMSLRIASALSYFLTFSCIVSLPLHKLAVRHVQD